MSVAELLRELRVGDLCKFIEARHAIYVRRQRGEPKPWTNDGILQNYRFCNVYRELDKETQWIAQNWREPNRDDPDLWFAMLVARVVNWSPALEELDYPVPWSPARFARVLNERSERGDKVWTGAYMITTHKFPMPKIEYYAERVLDPAWRRREDLRPARSQSLNSYHPRLMMIHGISSFLAGQVVADLKYAPVLANSPDWWTWSAPGIGSLRGMNRVLGRDLRARISPVEFKQVMDELYLRVNDRLVPRGMSKLHAQDLQNCLCEFDKYERVRLGQGVPRNRYLGRK